MTVKSLTSLQLYQSLNSDQPPLVIDVRKSQAFTADTKILPNVKWRDPLKVEDWAGQIQTAQTVVVYCVHGHEVGKTAARKLRDAGINAHYLSGGIETWHEAGFPVANTTNESSAK